jgi:hypothetical protein
MELRLISYGGTGPASQRHADWQGEQQNQQEHRDEPKLTRSSFNVWRALPARAIFEHQTRFLALIP